MKYEDRPNENQNMEETETVPKWEYIMDHSERRGYAYTSLGLEVREHLERTEFSEC